MKNKFDKVYQFKVTLKGTKPPIWRRIQVPGTYTFWDLHVAVQDAMGWFDYHLHHFEILNPTQGVIEEIGIPDEDFDFDQEILPGWEKKIARYFSGKNDKAAYVYDYGDDWHHTVKLEKILPRKEGTNYPLCSAGKRACPPEDCGGPWGYEEFLKKIMDPNREGHKELLEWVGGEFDPEHFNIDDVQFDDPAVRRESAFNL